MIIEYADLLDLAKYEQQETGIDVNTAIKEILHYDILYSMSQSSLGKSLVFQGGTALRLCYKGSRYSEDLDFVCGGKDVKEQMSDFETMLQDVITSRYGLDVNVKSPKSDRIGNLDGAMGVNCWTAVINVPQPKRSDKQSQKIKIEVASVPSYDPRPLVLSKHYSDLAPAYDSIILQVSSEEEIMADKILAVAGRPYLKARDIWDLRWLTNKNVPVNHEFMRMKLEDYGETEQFEDCMRQRIEMLRDPETVKKYDQEMSRFLSLKVQQQMRNIDNFSARLLSSVAGSLESNLNQFLGEEPKQPNDLLFSPD